MWGLVGADWRWVMANTPAEAARSEPRVAVRSAARAIARLCITRCAAGAPCSARRADGLPRGDGPKPVARGPGPTTRLEPDRQPTRRPTSPLPFGHGYARSIDDGLPAVVARDVSKTFRLPQERVHTLKERALHPRRRNRYQTFQALDHISFAVERGEFFGIAGRNGSGKSTLLKCIAGIYGCEGDIWCRGRLSTFIELGRRLQPEPGGRRQRRDERDHDGAVSARGAQAVDSVIEFAELEEFRDLKLKNYSSGMHVRLAFSVAIQVDADILLIDEVLAVGDAAFQQKCFDVFYEMRKQGKTIVFVTHDMGALNRFCHRALLLERGSMVRLGDADGGRRALPRDQLRARSRPSDRDSKAAGRATPRSCRYGSRTSTASAAPRLVRIGGSPSTR